MGWESFGVSVIGPGHVRTGLPNQDAYAMSDSSEYNCVVVSDGVGSAVMSDVGSRMVCDAVLKTAEEMVSENRNFNAALFVAEVKERFLRAIEPLTLRECSATCLFSLSHAGELAVGMLGDGLIAIQKKDGQLEILRDDKTDSFSNLVFSFAESTRSEEWKTLVMPENLCRAVVLCTDGVGDDLIDIEGFMKGFIEEYSAKDVPEAIHEVQLMLKNWPTPKHSDDKTIACMFRREDSHAKH